MNDRDSKIVWAWNGYQKKPLPFDWWICGPPWYVRLWAWWAQIDCDAPWSVKSREAIQVPCRGDGRHKVAASERPLQTQKKESLLLMSDPLSSPVGDPAEIARRSVQLAAYMSDNPPAVIETDSPLWHDARGLLRDSAQEIARLLAQIAELTGERGAIVQRVAAFVRGCFVPPPSTWDPMHGPSEWQICQNIAGMIEAHEAGLLASLPAAPVSKKDDDVLTRSGESMTTPRSVSTRLPNGEA